MNIKSTEELNKILKKGHLEHFDEYISKGYGDISLKEYFDYYLQEHKMTRADIIKKSNLARTYGYQILNGTRKAGRNKLLALCIAAEMPLDEIQRVLKIAKENVLYPRDPRDAAILSCIHHGIYDLNEINSFLYEKQFEVIR